MLWTRFGDASLHTEIALDQVHSPRRLAIGLCPVAKCHDAERSGVDGQVLQASEALEVDNELPGPEVTILSMNSKMLSVFQDFVLCFTLSLVANEEAKEE
ncbi:hypothetical protein MUG91_G2n155 [Manis pentadactyla]|nr:hypothetical protein MUG91_G2n155 [Manis pentadactyla]